MLIGIDVGGTYTDAALIEAGRVKKWAKIPTRRDILSSLLEALDEVTEGIDPGCINRVSLSTTLITNLIAEEKAEPVGLIAIPGPGANPGDFPVFADSKLLKGSIDYRGRETQPLDLTEAAEALDEFNRRGIQKVAVVGKFSVRNNQHEIQIAEMARKKFPDMELELGHQAAGQLNFPRRAATCRLTAATRNDFNNFSQQVQNALRQRGIKSPVYILKADGGTMLLEKAARYPVETIFSGPAASTMGVIALTAKGQTSVVVDVGGTTTDLALILSGRPLLSSRGLRIGQYLTQVRGFAVKSVALGGDSQVLVENGKIRISPQRVGTARCLGGPVPTPTDALRVLALTDIGDAGLARAAIADVAAYLGITENSAVEKVAQQIVDEVIKKLVHEINEMFHQWEQEPAYRVWEVMQKEKIRPQNVVGVGGSAPSLVPLVARAINCHSLIPPFAPVANAVGAAVARPTIAASLRVDTETGVYTVAEDGHQDKLRPGEKERFHLEQAEALALRLLSERALSLGLGDYGKEAEVTHRELFNVIRGWSRVGRIIDVRVQITPGLIGDWISPADNLEVVQA
ncbi:MAG: hydantoinase/oxoprolinase family protein [Syntrophomonadaceae bacterium]|nr:hydantoinase/oxoprolinase family protein [Syntrophomonadaceae bacterium]